MNSPLILFQEERQVFRRILPDNLSTRLAQKASFVICSQGKELDVIRHLIEQTSLREVRSIIPINGCYYIFLSGGVEIHDPLKAGSQNCEPSPSSDAKYFFSWHMPSFDVHGQELKRQADQDFACTSCHYHKNPEMVEKYFFISGEGVICLRLHHENGESQWAEIPVKSGMEIEVPAGMEHQLFTTTSLTTCLLMKFRNPRDDGYLDTLKADHWHVQGAPVPIFKLRK